MNRFEFTLFCIVLISFVSLIFGSIGYCSRGCDTGYKNNIDVMEYGDSHVLSAPLGINESTAIEVRGVLFECSLKGSGCSKKKFTFYFETKDENGKWAILNNANEIKIIITADEIHEYMKFSNISGGELDSCKIKDVSFSVYNLKSDNFILRNYVFNPDGLGG